MGHRLTKIYTRTGDTGTTGLGDGNRVNKDDIRIEAIGTVDELNCLVGMILANKIPPHLQQLFCKIQHQLFDLGGELCIPGHSSITNNHVSVLEQQLDSLNEDLPALKNFILPAGGSATASCHLARSVCRRAERHIVTLSATETINSALLSYINRLSDLLFVCARVLARFENGEEVLWLPDTQ